MHIFSAAHQLLAPPSAAHAMKLLVPVDATERSRWGIHYAMQRAQSLRNVEVLLLLVAEPIESWQVLRFLSQERVRALQAERGKGILEDAAESLRQAGISVQLHYQEGDVAFEILDSAERLDCDEIVLPVPYPRWTAVFSSDIVREVLRRRRSIPVMTVNAEGMPEPHEVH